MSNKTPSLRPGISTWHGTYMAKNIASHNDTSVLIEPDFALPTDVLHIEHFGKSYCLPLNLLEDVESLEEVIRVGLDQVEAIQELVEIEYDRLKTLESADEATTAATAIYQYNIGTGPNAGEWVAVFEK